jgi:hypothetical protein
MPIRSSKWLPVARASLFRAGIYLAGRVPALSDLRAARRPKYQSDGDHTDAIAFDAAHITHTKLP